MHTYSAISMGMEKGIKKDIEIINIKKTLSMVTQEVTRNLLFIYGYGGFDMNNL